MRTLSLFIVYRGDAVTKKRARDTKAEGGGINREGGTGACKV